MNIEIRGLEQLTRRMAERGNGFRPMLERTTDKAVKWVHSQVPPYPPPPPTSTYRRTGLLGRSITTEVRSLGSSVVGVIGTSVVYAPDVISTEPVGGRGPQTWYHKRTGWYTLQKVVEGQVDKIKAIYQDAIRKLLGS